jgi:homoserine dehydrogenase
MAKVVVGMLGLGTVGTGVVKLLSNHRSLSLKRVAVKDLTKAREVDPRCQLTTDPDEVVNDPEIEVLIEVMGGEQPALALITKAIESRKHVVTANKEVLAKHGPDLFKLAREKGVAIFFEASVAGGVPLISTIQKGLGANQLESILGILNGTTNFILSQMEEKGESFDAALAMAQKLGFAEADPTNDVEGFDVAYKVSILAALAFGSFVRPEEIFRRGITHIKPIDLEHAREFGYRIKLIGRADRTDSSVQARVEPCFVPVSHPLASVSGGNNGIVVNGHAVGELMMVGPGAGQLPTASAIMGDVINLAAALRLQDFASYFHTEVGDSWQTVSSSDNWKTPYYIRLEVEDHPGVIGKIGSIFGANQISIQSILQRGVEDRGASVVILTHPVKTGSINKAIEQMKSEEFLKDQGSCIAIFNGKNGAGK